MERTKIIELAKKISCFTPWLENLKKRECQGHDLGEIELFANAVETEVIKNINPIILKKPFALFAGAIYYPDEGVRDFQDYFKTLKEAKKRGKEISSDDYQWWQVVDLITLKIIAEDNTG